ncbi:hypothetical protein CHS0354_035187, partial [Potamilus streckersoni]
MDLKSVVAPYALNFNAYSPIEPPEEISRRLGISPEQIIKLDANENPYGIPQGVKTALAQASNMHIYPDPAQRSVRREIEGYTGIDGDMIVAGAGADELLDLVCRIFISPGDRVLMFSPSFSYYDHVIRLSRGIPEKIPFLPDFSYDTDTIRKYDMSRFKAVFLCSPNNPTGVSIPDDTAEFFLQHKNLPVIMDEAYYEFSGKTWAGRLHNYPNLIILRTFSKIFALAGFRIGYGMMSRELASVMMAVKPPYSVTVPSEIALKACLRETDTYRTQIKQLVINRDRLIAEINRLPGFTAFPSDANFFLCR